MPHADNSRLHRLADKIGGDLRSKLLDLDGLVALLEADLGDVLEDDDRRSFTVVHATMRQLDRIADELLELTRGDTELRGEMVDLGELVDEVHAELRLPCSSDDALVHHAGLPVVYGDRPRLRQLFRNLFVGGIKYRGTTRIDVRARPENGGWCIEVSDDGMGFDPARARAFLAPGSPLRMLDAQTPSVAGLESCLAVIDAHGGTLDVARSADDATAVLIRLPRADAPAKLAS